MVEVLCDVGVTPLPLYTGLTALTNIRVRNPTPLCGGPAVTAYLGYSNSVTTSSYSFAIPAGITLCVPVYGLTLYAVAAQWGLLGVTVVT